MTARFLVVFLLVVVGCAWAEAEDCVTVTVINNSWTTTYTAVDGLNSCEPSASGDKYLLLNQQHTMRVNHGNTVLVGQLNFGSWRQSASKFIAQGGASMTINCHGTLFNYYCQ